MFIRFKTFGVVAVVLLGLLVCGCENDDDKLGDGHDFGENDENVITAMGDSLTESGWPAILEGMIGKRVINRGRGGALTGHGAGQVRGVLAADKPGFLLIQYGANDMIRQVDIDTATANLRSIIVAAKENKTIPVIATLTPMYGDHDIFDGQAEKLSREIRRIAGEEGAKVADLERSFGDDITLVGDDGLHPTSAGVQEMAATFYDVLD